MARRTTAKKQETHDKIVRTAAAALRRNGYDGVGVADVMDEAGLTHGGFYAHFENREALLLEALDAAAGETIDRLGKVPDGALPGKKLQAIVDHYLSDRHVANVERGCTLAALGGETVRQSPEIRHVMTRRVKELADLVARQLPTWGDAEAHDDALAVMSTLLGALLIARAVDEPALAKSVRDSAREMIDRATASKTRTSSKGTRS
jgi:TetR/AcrR family transcriptional repressor of nem operon